MPLTYTLSSCIAHGGGDGHVERGLDSSCEDEYQLGDEYSDESEESDSGSDQVIGPPAPPAPPAIPLPQPNNGIGSMAFGPAPAHPVPQIPQATLAAYPTNTTINNDSEHINNVRGRVDRPTMDVEEFYHVACQPPCGPWGI